MRPIIIFSSVRSNSSIVARCERSVNAFSLSQGARLSGKARTSRRPCKAAAPKHPHLHLHLHLQPLLYESMNLYPTVGSVLIFLPNLYLHLKYTAATLPGRVLSAAPDDISANLCQHSLPTRETTVQVVCFRSASVVRTFGLSRRTVWVPW